MTSWPQIAWRSTAVAIVAMGASLVMPISPIYVLMGLFIFGGLAGAWARRQGWLSGVIVGLPMVLVQLTARVARESASLSAALAQADFWRIIVPTALSATGVAILGGIVGAWVQSARWQQQS